MGYLPPEGLYDRDVYQVWQTPFDRGSLEATLARDDKGNQICPRRLTLNCTASSRCCKRPSPTMGRSTSAPSMRKSTGRSKRERTAWSWQWVSEILRLGRSGRKELAEHVCQAVGDRGFKVISVGAESTSEAIDFARHAESIGASAVMAIPPVATALGSEATQDYFASICRVHLVAARGAGCFQLRRGCN